MDQFAFLQTSINVIKRKIFKVSPLTNNHLKVNTNLKYTEWTGQIDDNWHNADNWSDGLPFRYLHAFIPRVPRGNHFPQIAEACQIEFTIKNEGIIANREKVEVTKNGLLQNFGILKIEEKGELHNRGKLINHGTLRNAGKINSQNIFCNLHIIENTGIITKESRILQLSNLINSEINPLSILENIKNQPLTNVRK